jgi:hypothetical protein
MPFRVQWYIPGQIIYARYEGTVDVDELKRSILEMNALRSLSNYPLVHDLVDGRRVVQSVGLKETMKAVPAQSHPRMGWSINVGEASKLQKFIESVATQVLGVRYRHFDTIEEAVAFLKEIDSALDWSNANAALLSAAPEKTDI